MKYILYETRETGHRKEYLAILKSHAECSGKTGDELEVGAIGYSFWSFLGRVLFKKDAFFFFLDTNKNIKEAFIAGLLGRATGGLWFHPYPRDKDDISFVCKLRKFLQFYFLVSIGRLPRVYFLNDSKAIAYMNDLLDGPFLVLPDPVQPFEEIPVEFTDKEGAFEVLLFGSISERKGLFELLNGASVYLKSNLRERLLRIVIAGEFQDSFKKEGKQAILEFEEQFPGVVEHYEGRIGDHEAHLLFSRCDLVSCLYTQTNGSSGILGKAAVYGKPVIAPHKGLLAEIVDEYELGVCVDVLNPNEVASVFASCMDGFFCGSSKVASFVEKSKPSYFSSMILNSFERDFVV